MMPKDWGAGQTRWHSAGVAPRDAATYIFRDIVASYPLIHNPSLSLFMFNTRMTAAPKETHRAGRETVGAMRGTWWQWLIVVLIFAMFTLTLAAGLYVRLAGCDGARPTAPRTRGSDGESSAHA